MLGLPWGVCMGEMKAGSSREGVPRLASSMLCEERVCESGGGTGRAKSCLWALVKGDPEAIARATVVVLMWRLSASWLLAGSEEKVSAARAKSRCESLRKSTTSGVKGSTSESCGR